MVAISGGRPFLQEGNKPGSFGRPLPGLSARILEISKKELHAGEIGFISLFGSSVCNDYLDDEGWLNTNIHGHLDEQGFLFVDE